MCAAGLVEIQRVGVFTTRMTPALHEDFERGAAAVGEIDAGESGVRLKGLRLRQHDSEIRFGALAKRRDGHNGRPGVDDGREPVDPGEDWRGPAKVDAGDGPERRERKRPESNRAMKIEIETTPVAARIEDEGALPSLNAGPPKDESGGVNDKQDRGGSAVGDAALAAGEKSDVEVLNERKPDGIFRRRAEHLAGLRMTCYGNPLSAALQDGGEERDLSGGSDDRKDAQAGVSGGEIREDKWNSGVGWRSARDVPGIRAKELCELGAENEDGSGEAGQDQVSGE